MAEITHQLYPNIVIDTNGTEEEGSWNYKAKVGDKTVNLPSSLIFDPATLEQNINNPGHPVYDSVSAALRHLSGVKPTQVTADRGILEETVGPSLQSTVGTVLGVPADVGNLLLGVPDAGINFMDWAFKGFEGDMPSKRYLAQDPRKVFGGSYQINKALEAVGDLARQGTRATQEAGLNVTIPDVVDYLDLGLGGKEVGARTLFDIFSFDTTPDESTKTREYVSLITKIIGAAPVEGALIAKLAVQLAKTTKSPTAERVYEAISEMQRNNPIKAAAVETGMGGVVSGGMVASLEALEKMYPDAPQWMKNTVMAGGGILFPIGAMTVGSTAWDVGLKTPFVKMPLQLLRGLGESLTPSGAEKAAARAVQTMGGDWKHRNEILGVTGQLRLALKEGRNMDVATRIAFTTPQLARNEANVLEAQFQAARKNMSDGEVAAATKLIQDLRQFANFQEGQLQTLSTIDGVGAEAYAKYSGRMMERRDSIFAALDDAILKLDLGGKSDEGVDASVIRQDYDQGVDGNYVYNVNRLRAMKEGRLGDNVTPEQTQAISKAYDNALAKMEEGAQQALRDAQERIRAIQNRMPKDMTDQDRLDFNTWIRRELETAYKEIDGYEDILWNGITGMNRPKTESYITADGADLGPQILIDGLPIGKYFAGKVSALDAGEAENQTKYLWKLSGRDALVEEAGKVGGPNAEKVAKQNVQIKQQEGIVAERRRQLEEASNNLTSASKTPSESPSLRTARAEVAKLVAELGQIPKGSTIEDPTVLRRINAVTQKLTGTRAKVAELEASEPTSAALTKAQNVFEKAQGRLNEAQIKLDTAKDNLDISLGKGVTDADGNVVKLEEEILDTSILGVREVDGVLVGRKPQELQNIISLLKAEMAAEGGKANRKPAKIAAIARIIDDLQRAIPENFSVDTAQLGAARQMTATKKRLFETGDVGRIRGFNTKGEPNVQLEKTIEKIAAPTNQEVNLRQLEAALTRVVTGEDTPFRIVTKEDGTVGPELDLNFGLKKYAEGPPPPFESIDVGGGRSLGLRVAENTQPTEANIEIIRNTLWDRFRGFNSGETFDTAGAARWLENNGAAIRWLEKATKKDTGFENLINAERIVKTIEGSAKGDINKTLENLRKNGAFSEEFTEEGLRLILRESQKRQSNLTSAATFLDSPNPTVMGQNFLNKFLNDPNILNETLKVLDNGVLPNGSNPALEGFKRAVSEALIEQSLTKSGSGTKAAVAADKLTASLDRTVKLWDPDNLIGLSQDPRINRLLSTLYGKDAPELFRKIAEGARLQTSISDAATKGVKRQDKVSDEAAGNLGRIAGGYVAQYTPISSLVLTGVGRRAGIAAIANVRGSAIDKLIIDFLMNPDLAAAAIKKYPVLDPASNEKVMRRIRLWAHQKFIGDNARRIQKLGRTPGAVFEIGAKALGLREEELDDVDLHSSVVVPQQRQMASNVQGRPPISDSLLARTSGIGAPGQLPAQRPTGQASPETMQRGQQIFGPLDPIFQASHGGIVSVKRKGRQLVG